MYITDTKEQATKEAESMLMSLARSGWEISVWETHIWDYDISKGNASIVKGNGVNHFICYFKTIPKKFIGTGATPRQAYLQCIKNAKRAITQIENDINLLNDQEERIK